ncbi:hypothetical protein GCM10010149_79390 [Nonomuraea roseoviolacea subsp. roseoviolacea]
MQLAADAGAAFEDRHPDAIAARLAEVPCRGQTGDPAADDDHVRPIPFHASRRYRLRAPPGRPGRGPTRPDAAVSGSGIARRRRAHVTVP